jgi:hypothetical protein
MEPNAFHTLLAQTNAKRRLEHVFLPKNLRWEWDLPRTVVPHRGRYHHYDHDDVVVMRGHAISRSADSRVSHPDPRTRTPGSGSPELGFPRSGPSLRIAFVPDGEELKVAFV